MSENTATLTDGNFDDSVIKSTVPVLVDFWAEWCGPCRMIAPTVEELATDYDGKVTIGKLNVEEKIVLVATFSIHRKESSDACNFIMDYLKKDAPFWKKEIYSENFSWLKNVK